MALRWAGVNTDSVDTYLFAHGHEYKQALFDYTLVGGKMAMVRRGNARCVLNVLVPFVLILIQPNRSPARLPVYGGPAGSI